MTYTPHRWHILKIHLAGGGLYYRVLATWDGGYTTGDSWKMSSGITKITETETDYEFENASGSLYICRKTAVGASMYTMIVFDNYKENLGPNDIFEIISTKDDPLGGLVL